jgi:glycosyltransferase involved in cell wall biosynthesis
VADKLTIVFMNSISKDIWRGGEKWMVNAAAGLRDRGHTVVCIGKTDAVWLQKAKNRGLEIKEMNIHADFDPFIIGQLFFYFKKIKLDLICCNFEKDVRLGGIAAKLVGVPSIFVRKGLSLIYNKLRYRLAYKFIVDNVISPAYFIKNQFKKNINWLGQDRIFVVHNGVEIPDLTIFNKNKILTVDKKIERPVILGGGYLHSQKGFEYLIDALGMIHRKGVKAHLVVAGDGDPEQYAQQIKNLHIQEFVHFPGHRSDLSELMYGADCFVLSSIDEGLPNVVLEAMSVGAPVVSTDAGGANEIIENGKNGFIVPIRDAQALADKIYEMLTISDVREVIAKEGFEAVRKKFTIVKMVDAVEELFIENSLKKT